MPRPRCVSISDMEAVSLIHQEMISIPGHIFRF